MESQIVVEKQDLTYLSWSKARQSSGTAGSFLKSYDDIGGRKVYYKLSDYDAEHGIVGHECINEIVVDRLLEILGVEHLSYRLIHADVRVGGRKLETWLNASEDFKRPGESKIALDTFYELERKPGEGALDFCMRMGWREQVWECIAVDFLILNRDRHGAWKCSAIPKRARCASRRSSTMGSRSCSGLEPTGSSTPSTQWPTYRSRAFSARIPPGRT